MFKMTFLCERGLNVFILSFQDFWMKGKTQSWCSEAWNVAGSLVLLEGIDATITKTATIVPEFLDDAVYIFKPLQFQTQAVMKIACEPLNPSELPKMVSA